MTRSWLVTIALASLFLGLAACGDDDGNNPDARPGTIDGGGDDDPDARTIDAGVDDIDATPAADVELADLDDGIAAAFCAKLFSCCDKQEIADQPFGETEEECNTTLLAFIGETFEELAASVAADQIEYHADLAGQCLATISDLSCIEFQTADLECDGVFVGQVTNTNECDNDEECVTGYCHLDGNQPGVCDDVPGAGEECDLECIAGHFCDTLGDETCKPTLANGAECDDDDNCTSGFCDLDGECAAPEPDTTCDGT